MSKKEEYDMTNAKSTEQQAFFAPLAMKLSAIAMMILLVLAFMFCITVYCNKDALSTGILDLMKVLIGVVFGGIVSQVGLKK